MARRMYAALLASVLVVAASLGPAGMAGAAAGPDVSACPYFSSFLSNVRGTPNEPVLRALARDCASAASGVTHSAAIACSVPTTSYPTIASAFADANCSEVDLLNASYSENGVEVTHDVLLFGDGARIAKDTAGTVFTVDPGVTFEVQSVVFVSAVYGSHAITNFGNLDVEESSFIGSTVRNPSAPASDGGAISDFGTGTTITASVFLLNAGSLAGAIAHESNDPLTITNSAFIANGRDLSIAGAVYTNGGALDIETSLFAFNTTFYGDGAVVVDGGTYTHQNNLFLGNK